MSSTTLYLTDEEKWSIEHAESEHNARVRMVFFKMRRCKDCIPQGQQFKSCDTHMMEMVNID